MSKRELEALLVQGRNFMRKLMLRAATAAAAFAIAPAAQAAITVSTPTTVEARQNSLQTSISFDESAVETGSFNEVLTFNSDIASNLIFTLGTSFAGVSFTDVFVSQAGSTTSLFSLSGDRGVDINPEQLSGSFIANPGAFTLNIIGNNTGPGLGTLAGTVSMSAVPEPTTWAMMLIGFGAVGYSMRRRKVGSADMRLQAI
jgi:hypothetical protein